MSFTTTKVGLEIDDWIAALTSKPLQGIGEELS
jgi:hypothetical protein